MLAHALTAGASAAAAILIGHREEVTESAKAASRSGVKAIGTAGEALQAAFSAAMRVVHDSNATSKGERSQNYFPRRRAPMH